MIIQTVKCDFEGCNRVFEKIHNLENHKKEHNTVKPYKCRKVNCGKSFGSHSGRNNHEKSHEKSDN